jgi:hypothetical protein
MNVARPMSPAWMSLLQYQPQCRPPQCCPLWMSPLGASNRTYCT